MPITRAVIASEVEEQYPRVRPYMAESLLRVTYYRRPIRDVALIVAGKTLSMTPSCAAPPLNAGAAARPTTARKITHWTHSSSLIPLSPAPSQLVHFAPSMHAPFRNEPKAPHDVLTVIFWWVRMENVSCVSVRSRADCLNSTIRKRPATTNVVCLNASLEQRAITAGPGGRATAAVQDDHRACGSPLRQPGDDTRHRWLPTTRALGTSEAHGCLWVR